MPRPSSGDAPALSGLWINDKRVAWLVSTPAEFHQAYYEARQLLGGEFDNDITREIAMNIHWLSHGTSYIVDELIGGPWGD